MTPDRRFLASEYLSAGIVRWTLESVRDPGSNAIVELTLQCQKTKTRLPLQMDLSMPSNGDVMIPLIAKACKQAEQLVSHSDSVTWQNRD
jgi:hypothetical protein